MSLPSFFDRSYTIAKPGFSRWLVPPAALCVHLCIGQAYAFSVFNLPMSKLLGITHSAPGDWKLTSLGWIFSLGIVFLGLSAAVAGTWLDRVGPRKAMFVAALCFSGGFFISAIGVYAHTLWLIYLGYGVLGGCGLGIGYISPVKTLITWFPDRPGMATGMAIMGFGGGAFIASPLSVWLMRKFSTPTHIGVAETFIVLGIIYLIFMLVDVAVVILAFAFEKENMWKLLWLIPQRLVWRWLMWYVLFKSFRRAIKGELQNWGVLKRTGNVRELIVDG